MVRVEEGKAELARRVDRVETRSGRERGIGTPRTHDVQGDFGIGEKPVPEVVREVRVGE